MQTKSKEFYYSRVTWKQLLKNNLSLVILLLIFGVGIFFTDSFLTSSNLLNVLRQVSINGVLAAGFTIVVISDQFDLSVGSIVGVSACFSVGVLNATHSMILGVLAGLLVGTLFGTLNGGLIRVIKGDYSDSYLITLGVSLLALGVAYTYTGGFNQYVDETVKSYRMIGKGDLYGIPNMALIMLGMMIVLQFMLKKTPYGRKVYMTGGNKVASYMSGVNTHWIKTSAFMLSGLCAGIAGVMMAARTGSAAPSTGAGYEFDAAIATIIGGNAAGRRSSSVFKTLIGVFILGFISIIMNLLNFNTVIQRVTKGVILLIALYVDRYREE